jgi:hypothetical protein
MVSHDIDWLHSNAPASLSFYKYWPDDGLFRPKLVANIWNNKIKKIVVTDGVHTLFNFNIVVVTQRDVLYQDLENRLFTFKFVNTHQIKH